MYKQKLVVAMSVSAMIFFCGYQVVATDISNAEMFQYENQQQGEVNMSEENNQDTGGLWNKTKTVSSDIGRTVKESSCKAWDKTKELGSEAWMVTKEGSAKVWHKTKEISGDAWDITKEAAEDVHHAVMGEDDCCCGGCRHHHKAEHNESKTLH